MGAAAMGAGALTAAGGLYSAYQQGQEGKAQAAYYSYLGHTANTNAGLALAAGQAESDNVGAERFAQEKALSRRVQETVGAQKAALAAGGAGASSRTAQDIISDTLESGSLDEQALQLNSDMRIKSIMIGAESRAADFRNQAGGYDIAGGNARAISRSRQTGTLLSTAGNVANSYVQGNMYAKYYGGQPSPTRISDQ